MIDDRELAGLDPFPLLDTEAGRLDAFLSSLGEAGWQRASRCAGCAMRPLRGGCGAGQEIAAFTSPATFFSTTGLHFLSAYDTGHTSPSSRFAASWKPRVE